MNNSKRKVCIYDGITLFIRDPQFIYQLMQTPEKYRLKGTYDFETKEEQNNIQGKWRNFDIYSNLNSRGYGIVLGGSLHKFKNKVHNYDTFYMDEFKHVFNEIVNELKFDPYQTDIWSLEAGLNNVLPQFPFKGRDYPNNLILLKPNPTSSTKKHFKKNSTSVKLTKGECSYKFYDKGSQFNLSNEIIRTECNCKRRPLAKMGFNNFTDLLNIDSHDKYFQYLLKIFENIILFQPEVFNHKLLKNEDRAFFHQFRNIEPWVALKKMSNYQFKNNVNKFEKLINLYSPINYKYELLKLMKSAY